MRQELQDEKRRGNILADDEFIIGKDTARLTLGLSIVVMHVFMTLDR